jgi:hypothetical protein
MVYHKLSLASSWPTDIWKRLNKYGFYQSNYMNGSWLHKTRPMQFVLCVDGFVAKYVNDEDVEHLKQDTHSHQSKDRKGNVRDNCGYRGARDFVS